MKIKINKRKLYKLHRKYIGASQIPVLFGEGYISVAELATQKKEGVILTPSLRMQIGSALEKRLSSEVKKYLEHNASFQGQFFYNDYKFAFVDEQSKMLAIPDFYLQDENENIYLVGDIKTTNNENAYSKKYILQVQTQMLLSGCPAGLIAVYNFSKGDMSYNLIFADTELQNEIKDKVKEFWEYYKTQDLQVLCNKKQDESVAISATQEQQEKIETILKLSEKINELTALKDKLKEEIAEAMKQASANVLLDADKNKLAVFVRKHTTEIDKEKLKFKLMNEYNDYLTTKETSYLMISRRSK